MSKICAVINTWNESSNMEACIRSLGQPGDYVDEILVCDNESRDDTAAIASRCGARVISHPRGRMVTPSRKFAYEQTDAEWIFAYDADERPSKTLLGQLRPLSQRNDIDVVSFAKRQYLFGKFIMHGGWHEPHFRQFFRRRYFLDNYRPDLEGPHFDFASLQNAPRTHIIPPSTGAVLTHYAYDDIESFVHRTLGKYGRLEAEDSIVSGDGYSISAMISKPLRQFARQYFRRCGYRDGMHGFVLALLMAYYSSIIEINKWFISTQPRKHKEVSGENE